MSEKKHHLTQEQRNKIAEWVNEHLQGTKMPCPVCKQDEWLIPDALVAAPQISPGGKVNFGVTYPNAPIICQVCGFTYFINSARIGISASDSKDEKSDEEEDKEKAPESESKNE